MLRHDLKRMASTLAAAALLWSAAGIASAGGTDAGTVISNTASVVFSVNAVVQPAVNSTAVDFVVDRRVDLTLTAVPVSEVLVNPSSNGAFLFTLTNSSNAALGFNLSGANDTTNPFAPPVDSFDPTAITVFVDAGTLGVYEPGVDTATTINSLGKDASTGVWLVGAIPAGVTSGSASAFALTATARETGIGGAALTQDAGPDVAATVQTVFADGAGATDAARDAAFSARGAFLVQSADVTITKTETLISDPINLGVNPRHIPGAVVQYVVTVTNAATSALPATSLTISDVVPANVTFAPDTYAVGQGIDLGGTPQTNVVDGDAGSFGAGTVTVTLPTLAAGASAVITFRVTVN